mmetsp:Transcript_93298/g.114268  ORF Transcript_93298/g.114268 Transcript_93298/m.114268 type:complete len:220 (-) Transcript_93298:220-879(-)
MFLHVHSLQAGIGQEGSLHITTLKFSQPGLHIASEVDTLHVGVLAVNLRLSSQRCGANQTSLRKVLDACDLLRVTTDEHISGVLTWQHRAKLCVRDEFSWNILGGMHAKVHLLTREGNIKLSCEQTFATDLRQGDFQALITCRRDDPDLNCIVARQFGEGLAQTSLGFICLCQGQGRPTGAQGQHRALGGPRRGTGAAPAALLTHQGQGCGAAQHGHST